MAEKTLVTRISQLYNTYEKWMSTDPVLKKGEIAFVEIGTTADKGSAHATQPPVVLFKVGTDGTKKFSELDWCSAKAADVHDWAKKSEADFISWAKENIVNETYVKTLLGDYSTTEQMNSAIAAAKSEAVTEAAEDATTKADKALADAKDYTDAEINKITTGAGYATTKDVDDAVSAEKERAEGVESGLDSRLTTAEGKITTLIGDDTNKSARTIANEELAAQLLSGKADADFKTLQELATWIEDHPEDASEMNQAITALQDQLSGINAGTGTVKKYVDDAIAALNIGNYALAADLLSLANRVSAIENASYATTADVATAKQEAIDDADGKLAAYKTVNDAAVQKAQEDAAQGISDAAEAKEIADANAETISGYGDIVTHDASEFQVAGNYEAAGTAQNLINGLDSNVTATAEADNKISVLTGVTQTDGKLTSKTEATLAAIAKTGNVNDLIQTEGDVLVFDCNAAMGW